MSEVDKFVQRCVDAGVVHMHVDWGEDAANMDAEQRAKVLNDMHDWFAVPSNNLASKLRGRASLLKDSGRCALSKFNTATMQHEAATPAEAAKARDYESFAQLLEDAANWIESHP